MFSPIDATYTLVHDEEESENQPGLSLPYQEYKQPQSWNRKAIGPYVFHALVFASYSALVFFFLFRKSICGLTSHELVSGWSPALPLIEYEQRKLKGSIWALNSYRGIPSSEIDGEWRRISVAVPGLRVSAEEIQKLNQSDSKKTWHRIPDEYGGGYLAMLEVFHLLHCLDAVRKATWPEFYPPDATVNQTMIRTHTDHCIDILRVHLMCSTDVVPILFYDHPLSQLPLPDFSTVHTCRNFDKILEWSYSNDRALAWDEIGLNLEHLPGEAKHGLK